MQFQTRHQMNTAKGLPIMALSLANMASILILSFVLGLCAQDQIPGKTAEEPEDTIYVLGPQREDPDHKPKDTVVVLTRQSAAEFLQRARPMPDLARRKGYGGCLGPTTGMLMIDTDPIDELFSNTAFPYPELRRRIDTPMESVPLFGGMLYGGVGHGTRIGLAGSGGSRTFGVHRGDTVRTAEISLGYGGFLVEKSLVAGNMNLILGGLLGAGGIGVTVSETNWSEQFVLDAEDRTYKQASAGAGMFVLELHGGFTYSILPWFHAGLQGTMPVFSSIGGFRHEGNFDLTLTDNFVTVNGGFQVRIVLGNIG